MSTEFINECKTITCQSCLDGISSLKAELETLKAENAHLLKRESAAGDLILKLQSQLEKDADWIHDSESRLQSAREVIEFYSNHTDASEIDDSCFEDGERARKWLEENK